MARKRNSSGGAEAPLVRLEETREDVVTEEDVTEGVEEEMLPNGPAAAAMLAAGVGCVALGLLVTLTAASVFVDEAMVFYEPVGSLSGKTTLAVVIWLVVWVVLNSRLKDKQVNFAKTFKTTLILVAIGLLGTFPPFYALFHQGG